MLLAAPFLAIRNAFGALAGLVTAGGVFAVSYYAPAAVQAGFAYLAAWFLLFGGLRPVVELARGRRQRWARGSDAAQLARVAGAPVGPGGRRTDRVEPFGGRDAWSRPDRLLERKRGLFRVFDSGRVVG